MRSRAARRNRSRRRIASAKCSCWRSYRVSGGDVGKIVLRSDTSTPLGRKEFHVPRRVPSGPSVWNAHLEAIRLRQSSRAESGREWMASSLIQKLKADFGAESFGSQF